MSHEGIRLIGEDEARQIAEEALKGELPREAVEPARVRVNKTTGTGIEIDWKDGHASQWSFTWLRDACPCATCHGARETEGRQPGEPKAEPRGLLPMYKAPVRPESAEPVGRYAIAFHWNDGHKTGIYSWTYLRRHCQCDQCRRGQGLWVFAVLERYSGNAKNARANVFAFVTADSLRE